MQIYSIDIVGQYHTFIIIILLKRINSIINILNNFYLNTFSNLEFQLHCFIAFIYSRTIKFNIIVQGGFKYRTSMMRCYQLRKFEPKTSLTCCVTLINVVLFGISLTFPAPTQVQADRRPPRISNIVSFTSPLYSTSTVFPSDALYSATPPQIERELGLGMSNA